jgi:hypothetical protein
MYGFDHRKATYSIGDAEFKATEHGRASSPGMDDDATIESLLDGLYGEPGADADGCEDDSEVRVVELQPSTLENTVAETEAFHKLEDRELAIPQARVSAKTEAQVIGQWRAILAAPPFSLVDFSPSSPVHKWFDEQTRTLCFSGMSGVDPVVHAKDIKGNTALHAAALAGNLKAMDYLASRGSDINAMDNKGSTGLHFAARSGNCDVMEWLVNHGVDPAVEEVDGCSAIYDAAMNGHLPAIQFLVRDRVLSEFPIHKRTTSIRLLTCACHFVHLDPIHHRYHAE